MVAAAISTAPPSDTETEGARFIVRVSNQRGRSVEEASVALIRRSTKETVASAQTDEEGRHEFVLPAAPEPRDDFYVRVSKAGYLTARWALGEDNDIHAVLHRVIDQSYIDRLMTEKDPLAARQLLLDLVCEDRHSVFPYIGVIRARILEWAAMPEPDGGDLKRHPYYRCNLLLACWDDARDKTLIEKWETKFGRPLPEELQFSGRTVDEVLAKWNQRQLGGFKIPPKPHTHVTYGPNRTRALVRWTLHMKHWWNQNDLVLHRRGAEWRLVRVPYDMHITFR